MAADKDKMMKRLWGDSYFNVERQIWINIRNPEVATEPLSRACCQFIMTSTNQLVCVVMSDDKTKDEKMMTTLCIDLKGNEKTLQDSR